MKKLLIAALLVLAAGCQTSVPCAKDLTKPASSCSAGPKKPRKNEWVTVYCGSSRINVRNDLLHEKNWCHCLEGINRFKQECH